MPKRIRPPRTPAYRSWAAMWQRCTNPKQPSYERYGGKGIEVCERWKAFKNFLADMGERLEGMTLDRIDSSKDYNPENCRWATDAQQRANRAIYKNSQTGVRGIRFLTGKWRARISIGNGKTKDLGGFETKEAALAALNAAKGM